MFKIWILGLILLFASSASFASVTADFEATWDAPSERTDGSELASADISHYLLECTFNGDVVMQEQVDGGETSFQSTLQLDDGQYVCELWTVDTQNRVSDPIAASFSISPPPGPAGGFNVNISISFGG